MSPIISGGSSSTGGGGSVLSATLTLNNAEIIALATTPAVIVPATTVINYNPAITPDVIYRPIAATAITSIVTGFTLGGADEPELLIAYSSDWANNASSKAAIRNGLHQVGTWQTDLPCPPTLAPDVFSAPVLGMGAQPVNGDWLDNALALALASATPTGGDPANTLTLTVLYLALAT